MKISAIYGIRNIRTYEIYLGSSKDIKQRFCLHKSALKRNVHSNRNLQIAWNQDSPEAFEFVILEECLPEELLEREQFWLDNTPLKYNISPDSRIFRPFGNQNRLNHYPSEETKQRISETLIGRKLSEEHKRKISLGNTGKDSSREAILKGWETRRQRKFV